MTGGFSQFARVLDSIPLVNTAPVEPLPAELYHAPRDEWEAAMVEKYGDNWENSDD